MITASQMRERLIEKATNDGAFRKRLVDDPRTTVEQEFGVSFPDDFSVTVHEESSTEAHLVLPPDGRLGEADLRGVAAAGGCAGDCLWTG